METRNITVVSTKTSSNYVISSGAETLRELKEDLNTAGIDYEDMTFYEGLTKTELKSDDSRLPRDVEYKGTTTNELVFMLTNTNKKIKSGFEIKNRFNAGKYFKENPEVAVEFKNQHDGRNWTNCSTDDILKFFSNMNINNSKCNDNNLEDAFKLLVKELYNEDILSGSSYTKINNVLNNSANCESPYSDSEIEDMFEDMR